MPANYDRNLRNRVIIYYDQPLSNISKSMIINQRELICLFRCVNIKQLQSVFNAYELASTTLSVMFDPYSMIWLTDSGERSRGDLCKLLWPDLDVSSSNNVICEQSVISPRKSSGCQSQTGYLVMMLSAIFVFINYKTGFRFRTIC